MSGVAERYERNRGELQALEIVCWDGEMNLTFLFLTHFFELESWGKSAASLRNGVPSRHCVERSWNSSCGESPTNTLRTQFFGFCH